MQRREFVILLSYAAIARPAVARAAVDDAQSETPCGHASLVPIAVHQLA